MSYRVLCAKWCFGARVVYMAQPLIPSRAGHCMRHASLGYVWRTAFDMLSPKGAWCLFRHNFCGAVALTLGSRHAQSWSLALPTPERVILSEPPSLPLVEPPFVAAAAAICTCYLTVSTSSFLPVSVLAWRARRQSSLTS